MIVFPEHYFEEETRDGFTIAGMMKRAWAAQMEVYETVYAICEKHGLKIYAHLGTLLGAVRHQGFIPWDDDMDSCMLRADYLKFLSIAKQELPAGYNVASVYNEVGHVNLNIRITNGQGLSWTKDWLRKYHGCPFVVGIDIFPLDSIPKDAHKWELKKQTMLLCEKTQGAYEALQQGDTQNKEAKNIVVGGIQALTELFGPSPIKDFPLQNQIYRFYDKACSLFDEEEAEEVTMMPDYRRWNGRPLFRKEWFKEGKLLPFETTKILVPVNADGVLRSYYGEDYMVPRNAACGHDYPFYAEQEKIARESGKWEEIINAINEKQEEPVLARNKSKTEVVFFPYKAAMWDSLESVYLAAKEDPDCDAYVVPIPYYDRKPDGSMGQMHYEGDLFPSNISITNYKQYDIKSRRPDIAYIHNPYDGNNFVTSVDPAYYSSALKKYVKKLVYIPYYATTGGMSDAQSLLPAYLHADYIPVQGKFIRKFFEDALPEEKFLYFGSPKFDRVIKMCKSPGQPPESWQKKMAGKKVYFYNTSLHGLLGNTPAFLRKMTYVFTCFQKAADKACLIWRPHPLFESTLDSMRGNLRPVYDAIKKWYVESDFGILDETPDITETISFCDTYVGDAATSVTSLFGVAGKEIILLNNALDREPENFDVVGDVFNPVTVVRPDGTLLLTPYLFTRHNQLFKAVDGTFAYRYLDCLGQMQGENYYLGILPTPYGDYVLPHHGYQIKKVLPDGKIDTISLKEETRPICSFRGFVCTEKTILLLPDRYSTVVRITIETGEVTYLKEKLEFTFAEDVGYGAYCVCEDYLLLASPTEDKVYAMDVETGKIRSLRTGIKEFTKVGSMISVGEGVWMLPKEGYQVHYWEPFNGTVKTYDTSSLAEGCVNPYTGAICEANPFGFPYISDTEVILPPCFGKVWIRIDLATGELQKWEEGPLEEPYNPYLPGAGGAFLKNAEGKNLYYSSMDRRYYIYEPSALTFEEVPVSFEEEDLLRAEPGFALYSDEFPYAATEDAINSLSMYLQGTYQGAKYNRETQEKAFSRIAATLDGTAGEKIHAFIKKKVER